MGVTGSSATMTMSNSLPEVCARVRKFAGNTPIAVGFGVNTREHFLSVGSLADGVVIGSKIVSLIKEAGQSNICDAIRKYCLEVSRPQSQAEELGPSHVIHSGEPIEMRNVDALATSAGSIHTTRANGNGALENLEGVKSAIVDASQEYSVIYQIS